ncbi:type VII secretion integral membrane protein EccD [Actinokineospora baliensis]|uniref:type VII secretion integral membrane protein EccD n=1 Tax=Actinokineospora baliensis TaxID=547056 RepID=UPI00195CA406|nr:type VII secretion integral membrane protein EccD [Actinokineospora baliensis]MBM7773652.1 type VII secretion integral membrane protein EccD [Actinokineospora baliensis]
MATTAAAGSGEMCRLTICGPASRVELAVPAHVPLADLMPTVLGHLDPALATTGLAHGGWVLQRLGEPPLDEDQGTAALGLYDGDLLHLRPRDALLPLVDFDDLVDGIHTGLSARDDKWRPALTRRVFVVLMGLVAAAAVFVAGVDAIRAGGLAVVLLGAAMAASRALADRPAALLLATAGTVSAAMAGVAIPGGSLTGPGVLAGAAAATVAAVIARVAVGGPDAAFTAVGLAALLATIGGGFATATGLGGAAAASVTLVLALTLVRAAPLASARLAGLAVDQVPTSAAEFQQDLDPQPSARVLDSATRANAYLTAFFIALGAVAGVSMVVLALHSGWDAKTLTAVTAVLMLLHARELNATHQRLSAMVPAFLGLLTLLLAGAAEVSQPFLPAVLGGLVVVAGLALAAAHVIPDRKLVPRWGRWGDLLHWASALAVIPLALSAIGVYAAIMAAWS